MSANTSMVGEFPATIHKAQGSEYPAVVIPVSTQHYPMLQRNLIYTGITRGQRSLTRWSNLADWLR